MEKRKILIVDDDANIAELIALYLTKECFQCEIAEDGETALEKHQSFQPDLILLDIMLPGIDGYDVLREIRKQYTTPVIMLSAKGETFDKVLGLELGADDYIIKLFCNRPRKNNRNATKRAGAVILPCFSPESGIYKRAAFRPNLGV